MRTLAIIATKLGHPYQRDGLFSASVAEVRDFTLLVHCVREDFFASIFLSDVMDKHLDTQKLFEFLVQATSLSSTEAAQFVQRVGLWINDSDTDGDLFIADYRRSNAERGVLLAKSANTYKVHGGKPPGGPSSYLRSDGLIKLLGSMQRRSVPARDSKGRFTKCSGDAASRS